MSQAYIELDKIGILHRTNEVTQPRWRQDAVYKFVLSFKGPISYVTPRSKLNVRSGQFLLFNPGDRHQQVHCTGDKFLVEFSPILVSEVTQDVMGASAVDVRFKHVPAYNRDVARMANMLIAELAEPRPGQRLMLEHAALQLLVLAVRSIHPVDSSAVLRLDTPSIQKAVQMMTECYRDPLTLDGIAGYAGMSKFSLIRQFRQVEGLTPYEWLQQYRLRQACEDLLMTQRKVLDLALDHGFSSASAFNREFRRTHGISPTQWRRLHQEDKNAGDQHDADTRDVKQDSY